MKNTGLMIVAMVCMSFIINAQERGDYRHPNGNNGNNGGRNDNNWNDRNDRSGHHDSQRWDGRGGSGSTVIYVTQRVWVEGCSEQVWVPARYEYVRQSCGRMVRVCVCEGYYTLVRRPGYYTYQRVPVYGTGGHCPSGNSVSVSWRW